MKKIAIITGASSGIGKEFAKTISQNVEFDELWIIARRLEKLEELKKELSFPVKTISLDLSDRFSYEKYDKLLQEEKTNGDFVIQMLMNCSGFGRFCATMDASYNEYLNMLDLNCGAIVALCQISIPYMTRGSKIINIGSVAGFQPIPYINVYSSSKSFVINYSRALKSELEKDGIHVMTVCPFWTQTEFFNRAINKEQNPVVTNYIVMYKPEQIVQKAWKDLKRNKEVSIFGFIAAGQALLTKIFPHSFVMKQWKKQQKLK